MRDPLEEQPRLLFREDADRASASISLLPGGFLTSGPAAGTGGPAQVVSGYGALPADGQASCAKEYSSGEVAEGGSAFSGTVRSFGPGRTNRAGVEMDLVSATFSRDH